MDTNSKLGFSKYNMSTHDSGDTCRCDYCEQQVSISNINFANNIKSLAIYKAAHICDDCLPNVLNQKISLAFFDGDILATKLKVSKATIERSLGLNQRSLSDKAFLELPETQALLRLVYNLPFLLEIADRNFNPKAAALILQREAAIIQLEQLND